MSNASRHVAAFCSMVLGCGGVLGLVYYMNELNQPPKKEEAKVAKDFKVEKLAKKKPEVKKKQVKPKKTVRTERTAPMPNISSPMSGLSFDLPQFASDDLFGADTLLSGSESSKSLVMTGDSVDTLPRPRTRKAPEYPSSARERGIEGQVVLSIKVSEDGRVEQVRVVDSEPRGVFDTVAIAAVNDWTFDPAKYQGKAVAVSVSQRIPFRLN